MSNNKRPVNYAEAHLLPRRRSRTTDTAGPTLAPSTARAIHHDAPQGSVQRIQKLGRKENRRYPRRRNLAGISVEIRDIPNDSTEKELHSNVTGSVAEAGSVRGSVLHRPVSCGDGPTNRPNFEHYDRSKANFTLPIIVVCHPAQCGCGPQSPRSKLYDMSSFSAI